MGERERETEMERGKERERTRFILRNWLYDCGGWQVQNLRGGPASLLETPGRTNAAVSPKAGFWQKTPLFRESQSFPTRAFN